MTSEINRCYRVLELEPGASMERVKQARLELVKVWHPDRFPNDSKLQHKAQERLKDINGAYKILEQYLNSGTPPPQSSPSPSQSSESNRQEGEQNQKSKKGQTETPPPAGPTNPWPKNVIWLAVIGVVALNAALVFRSCRNLPGETLDKAGKVIEKAGKALADVASAFSQGTIRTEFVSYATTITNQHYLQFATFKQTEMFTRSETTTTGFGYIPLPEVVVEARAPVETTYYLDLNAKWDFVLKDNVVYVFAPPIRFNKPSVDASAITYEVRKGYLKTAEALENLKKSVTSLATLKAKDNISLVRENGRRQTTEFVERWLMKSFTDGKQYSVKVFFPDEKPPEDIRPNEAPLR